MPKAYIVTPRGTLVYPRLSGEPDTKFDADGVYKTALRVESERAQDLIAEIEGWVVQSYTNALDAAKTPRDKKAVKQTDDRPYKLELDDDGDETGFVLFSFKMKAAGVSKKTGKSWTRKPKVFDSVGVPMVDENITIGGGSEARVSFDPYLYHTVKLGAGVSLRLEAVQIITLVEWAGNASGFGFEDESGEGNDDVPTVVKAAPRAKVKASTDEDEDDAAAGEDF